jgi:predicted DNA-binding transcriptional regulator AlpA
MAELCADQAERAAEGLAEGAWAHPGWCKAAAHEARGVQTFAVTSAPAATPIGRTVERVTAEILGISPDTLRRLNRRGEGPTRRKISPRRVGYKVSEVEAYRDGEPLTANENKLSRLRSPRGRSRARSR